MKEAPCENVKLIWQPEVYLVSCPAVHSPGVTAFLKAHNVAEWTSDAETPGDFLPEMAGRLCYMSYQSPRPGGNKAYLKNILDVGHLSVVEHSNFGFVFAGVSRSLTHELVRHRAGLSYSQLSQRYVDESDVAFVIPPAFHASAHYASGTPRRFASVEELIEATEIREPFYLWWDACSFALGLYGDLLHRLEADQSAGPLPSTERRKWARQTARSVLPNCTETKIFVTGNLRAWRHFLELRTSRHAEVEIRRLANIVYPILLQEAPHAMSGYQKTDLKDGTFELQKA